MSQKQKNELDLNHIWSVDHPIWSINDTEAQSYQEENMWKEEIQKAIWKSYKNYLARKDLDELLLNAFYSGKCMVCNTRFKEFYGGLCSDCAVALPLSPSPNSDGGGRIWGLVDRHIGIKAVIIKPGELRTKIDKYLSDHAEFLAKFDG